MKRVCAISDVAPNKPYSGLVGSTPIAIFQIGEAYFAIEDACPHQYLPLSGGEVQGEEVICPFHGARFNLTNGAHMDGPGDCDLTLFTVTVKEDGLWIEDAL